MESKRIKVIDEYNILIEGIGKVSKNHLIDGTRESMWIFDKCKDSKGTWGSANFPKSERTVYIYSGDNTPFINTYANLEKMFNRIFEANPHLKFKFETIDDYRGSINWWFNNYMINGYSYYKVASEITHSLEMECYMNYGVYWNPYSDMSEEDVCGIENKLREEEGLDPIEKFHRDEEEC